MEYSSRKLFILGTVALMLVALIAVLLFANFAPLFAFNLAIYHATFPLPAFFVPIMLAITAPFSTKIALILSALGALFLWKKPRALCAWILAIGLTEGFVAIIKYGILIARPPEHEASSLVAATGPSFPSGHTAFAAVFFTLIYLFYVHTKPRTISRNLFAIFCIVMPFLVGLSRITLGAHWISDVVGGYFLGLGFALVSTALMTMRAVEKPIASAS